MTNQIKIIGFDLDDTLWPVSPIIKTANEVMWAYLIKQYATINSHFSMHDLVLEMRNLESTADKQHRITLRRMVAIQNLLQRAGMPIAKAVDLSGRALDIFLAERHKVTLYDGALECIKKLKQHYKIASISNGNANIRRLGLADYFDFSICAEDINSSKPAPALFETTLIHFGCEPEAMIYIGDHLDHDVLAAQACGMHSIWLNRQNYKTPHHIEYEARNFNDVERFIATISNASMTS